MNKWVIRVLYGFGSIFLAAVVSNSFGRVREFGNPYGIGPMTVMRQPSIPAFIITLVIALFLYILVFRKIWEGENKREKARRRR